MCEIDADGVQITIAVHVGDLLVTNGAQLIYALSSDTCGASTPRGELDHHHGK